MCQGSLLPDSETSSPVWPARVTWDTAFAYELPTLVLPTVESVSSSLLPTPTAAEGRQSVDSTHKGGNPTLASLGSLLPTPQASDGDGGRVERTAAENGWKRPSGAKASKPLGTAIALLPTLTTDDANNITRESGDFQSLAREVHRRTGVTTPSPSNDGKPSCDPPPNPPMIGDA